jgi:hypothetical protein
MQNLVVFFTHDRFALPNDLLDKYSWLENIFKAEEASGQEKLRQKRTLVTMAFTSSTAGRKTAQNVR